MPPVSMHKYRVPLPAGVTMCEPSVRLLLNVSAAVDVCAPVPDATGTYVARIRLAGVAVPVPAPGLMV